jgi:hypothetical protein
MPGRSAKSEYFEVQGSGASYYTVTINHDTGHWCSCRGMTSKKSKFGADAGKSYATSCKHVQRVLDTEPRAAGTSQAARDRGGDRRAAVLATRAKRASSTGNMRNGDSLLERIGALERAKAS